MLGIKAWYFEQAYLLFLIYIYIVEWYKIDRVRTLTTLTTACFLVLEYKNHTKNHT